MENGDFGDDDFMNEEFGAEEFDEVYHDEGSDPDYTESDEDIDPALGALDDFTDDEGRSICSDVDDEDISLSALNDEMDTFHADLRAASGFKKPRRTGGRRQIGDEIYSFEIRGLLGQANSAYAFGKLDEAMKLVKQIIHIEPGVYSAWKILGEIFKEKGDKRKCLLAWLTAAHARPKDWELWVMCAKMSLDQYGTDNRAYKDQAVYCYNRAISAKPENIDAIYDRALLLKELGSLNKAAEGFVTLNRLLPNDMSVLKELAGLYIQMDKVPEAIEYYRRSVEHFKATGNPDNAFGWSELNIFVELYCLEKQWAKAIDTIGSVGRWLYGRATETYWDKINGDDREWDGDDRPRRCMVREFEAGRFQKESYYLPLELRVKLGLCRLQQENMEEAMHHFQHLHTEARNSPTYSDLFQEVGDALYGGGHFNEAISYYSVVVEGAVYLDRKLWFNMADCYKGLDNIEDAEDCYGTILEAYPKEDEAMMQLAGIYEVTGRKAEALDLVNQIIAMRREKEKAEKVMKAVTVTVQQAEEAESLAFFPNQPISERVKRKRTGILSEAEKMEMNAKRTEQTEIRYRKLEYLRPSMEAGDPEAVKEWLDTAGDLVDDFRNTRALYPHERKNRFKGFMTTAQRRALALGETRRIEKMQDRLKQSLTFEEEEIEEPEHLSRFRGLDFDTWLYIFMQYAICLAKYDNYQDSYDVCNAAKDANVFYHSKKRTFIIYVTWLACAIHVGDSDSCSTLSRWFMTTFQFTTEAYNLFTASITASKNGLEVFHNNANQKYLLRQIKAMDQVLTGERKTGAANLTGECPSGSASGEKYVPKEADVGLIMLYAHILASGKSYLSALNYYTRAYALVPGDALITFCIGLAYLHRSMQRQSENRHIMALQGISFIFDYYDIRCGRPEEQQEEVEKDVQPEKRQEAEYNVGRAFQHIGLTHLAIPYYERVLQISEENTIDGDLKWEAAYNLQMIYMTSGNAKLAADVTERYLVI
ncbi:hypothetical protein B9Z19DRAFT_1194856 [Tuber borchii]|uniref:TPR-like protein n=1 Tax=Tuber borchii TaxID=42251 RepID=A0A2T6ZLE1_TUBBO|nr:hypothetical protein B9Z19DRAFT_1194856 [Tuber borchii]